MVLSSFRVLGLFTDFGETSCWNWFSGNGALFGFGDTSCWNWFSGNGALFGFGGLGVLGRAGVKHADILPVNALIHDTIIWKSSEWINDSSSSDFWRRIPSTRPKAKQRTTFLFVDRRPRTNSQRRELHCLREDHQTLFDGIRQEILEHDQTNKTWKVFHCTKPNLAQTTTSLDPTKQTILPVTPCSPEATDNVSVDKSRCIYPNVAPVYDDSTI